MRFDVRWVEIFALFKSQYIAFENIYQEVEFFFKLSRIKCINTEGIFNDENYCELKKIG